MKGTVGKKIAHMTATQKNRPHVISKNRPHDEPKNRPNIINPVPLLGVLTEPELKELVYRRKQAPWTTRVRLGGLLLLIDYLLRHQKKSGLVSISRELARSFVSKIESAMPAGTIREPLPLLQHIGILDLVRPGVHVHVHAPAVYRLTSTTRGKVLTIQAYLTPKLFSKRANSEQRREKGLNRHFPFREQLLRDLNGLSFSEEARPIIAKISGTVRINADRVVNAVDGHDHDVRVSERGQITTSIGSCPRILQPHLLLYARSTVYCDIANAHWNFLPRILSNRLHHLSGLGPANEYLRAGWREHDQLTLLLSDGDFYRNWCVDPEDDLQRATKKEVLNILLNQTNTRCHQNRLYRRVAEQFPITFNCIEDLKRDDHRNLSKQLHRFTADAVAGALLNLQDRDIPAVPHVDAIISPRTDRSAVCEALGKEVFDRTGVCAKVGGARYSPLSEIEAEALAFDEHAPADNDLSYDEWEALRMVKTIAVLKLTRRLVTPFASTASTRRT